MHRASCSYAVKLPEKLYHFRGLSINLEFSRSFSNLSGRSSEAAMWGGARSAPFFVDEPNMADVQRGQNPTSILIILYVNGVNFICPWCSVLTCCSAAGHSKI